MFMEVLDELRTWPNDRLHAARDEAVREERRWRLRRVALDRALEDRGATGPDAIEWVQRRDMVKASTARAEMEVARRLDELPELAKKAEAGEVSFDQLEQLVQLATPETDGEWAQRGPQVAPSDLARIARRQRVVSPEEAESRQRAREFRWWWRGEMLQVRGQIPDVTGAFVETVFEHLINRKKPAPGEAWDTRAHRGADALVDLARAYQSGVGLAPKSWRPTVVVHMGSAAQPTVKGIPLATSTVAGLVAEGAKIRTVFDDDPLAPADGDRIPAALLDYLKARDPVCRVPGCERTVGLEAHHLVPRSWGGATDKHNIVMICTPEHQIAIPHGPWILDGDPEQPDGLTWHKTDQIDQIDQPGDGTGDARAGPTAA
jgi:hypothetical protein